MIIKINRAHIIIVLLLNSILHHATSRFHSDTFMRNSLHYCGIAMEISSERNAHWGDTDLRVERIRNSADCEQVLDKKPLSHDKLNFEIWGLAKLPSPIYIHSEPRYWKNMTIRRVWREFIYGRGVTKEFINIYMAFIGSKCMFIHIFSFHEEPRTQILTTLLSEEGWQV